MSSRSKTNFCSVGACILKLLENRKIEVFEHISLGRLRVLIGKYQDLITCVIIQGCVCRSIQKGIHFGRHKCVCVGGGGTGK